MCVCVCVCVCVHVCAYVRVCKCDLQHLPCILFSDVLKMIWIHCLKKLYFIILPLLQRLLGVCHCLFPY